MTSQPLFAVAGCVAALAACASDAAPAPPQATELGAARTEPLQEVPEVEPSTQAYRPSDPTLDDQALERYGPPLGSNPPVSLSELVKTPALYADKTVQAVGTVARVCSRGGCWVELQGEAGDRVRVPMAGHALAIPQHALGHRATVEGTVHARPLSEAQKAHYREEGMVATEMAVSIAATTVEVVK